jgi:hypothetical protein
MRKLALTRLRPTGVRPHNPARKCRHRQIQSPALIGGILKKKRQAVDPPTTTNPPTDATPPKQEVIFVPSKPVVSPKPRQNAAIVRAKGNAIVTKKPVSNMAPNKSKIADQRAKTDIATPEIPTNVKPLAGAAAIVNVPAATVVLQSATVPIPKPVIVDDGASGQYRLFLILAAIAAAAMAIGLSLKSILAPKIRVACNVERPKSTILTSPSLATPDIKFNVVLPGYTVSAPLSLTLIG